MIPLKTLKFEEQQFRLVILHFTKLQSFLTTWTQLEFSVSVFLSRRCRFCPTRLLLGLPSFACICSFLQPHIRIAHPLILPDSNDLSRAKINLSPAKRSHGQGEETEWCRKRGNQSVTHSGSGVIFQKGVSHLIWIKGRFYSTMHASEAIIFLFPI